MGNNIFKGLNIIILFFSLIIFINQLNNFIQVQAYNPITPFFDSPTPGPSQTPPTTLNPIQLLSVSPTASSSANLSTKEPFDLFVFIAISVVYIMLIHFAINTGSEFVTFLIIVGFVFGGFIGFWFKSYEFGLVVGIVFSLLFFGGPQKEM